jgi:hypothetical protein
MSVEFEGDEHKSILYAKLLQPTNEAPSLINWLTKSGIAKTPEGANHILIVVMLFSFVLTGYVVYSSYFVDSGKRTPEQDKQLLERMRDIRHTSQNTL